MTERIVELRRQAREERRKAYQAFWRSGLVETTIIGGVFVFAVGGLVLTFGWWLHGVLWCFWPSIVWQLAVPSFFGYLIFDAVRNHFRYYYKTLDRIKEEKRALREAGRAEPGMLSKPDGEGGGLTL